MDRKTMAIEITGRRVTDGRKGGKGGGGGSTRTAQEAPNTLQSRSTARLIDLVSEGEIEGLVDGLKSVFFDRTPVENADGSLNFGGVTIFQQFGTPTQGALLGFPSVETEFAVGAEVTFAQSVTRTVTNPDADAVRVKLRIPALTKQNTSNGDLTGTSVEIAIDVKNSGGSFVEKRRDVVSGKTTSPYEREYRIGLDAGMGPWEVRMRRLTADSQVVSLNNDTFFSSYTVLIDNKLSYPDSALYGLKVEAEQFGQNIPNRGYEIKGLKIQVPDNYNPITREYTGIWGGAFKIAWTDNPAWVLYDVLTNKRYGLGDFIDASQVDKFGLFTIGQYCDELVDDGFGGQEPRFTFNGQITTLREAYVVLQSIASAFRGMLYWGSGTVIATQDSPADPVKLVTKANVIDGNFNYEGSGLKARHSVALVTWNNPVDRYKAVPEVVEDPALIERFGYRPTSVVAFGCTSRGQARRYGRWILDSEQTETETVTYRASFDHADVRPGDIISVQDEDYADVRFGGRVKAATTSQVTLDAPVTLEQGQTYTLSVVLPDGSVEDRSVTTGAGETAVLDLSSALSDTPIVGAMWVVTASNLAPRQFRVVGVLETEKNDFQITALFHDTTKFARIEQNLAIEEPNFTAIVSGPLPAPQDLTTTEFLFQAGPAVKSAVTLSWASPGDPRVKEFEVYAKKPEDEAYGLVDVTPGLSSDILDTSPGSWEFQVRGKTEDGQTGPLTLLTVNLQGLLAPPADVTNFNVSIVGSAALLTWDPVADLDLRNYCIRFSTDTSTATWDSAIELIKEVPARATSVTVPALVGTYLIKAQDTSKIVSVNATAQVSTIDVIENLNVVSTATEDPGFTGTKTEVVLDGTLNGIRLDTDVGGDVEPEGTYEFANSVDLGQVYTSRVTPKVELTGVDLENNFLAFADLLNVANIFGAEPGEFDTIIELRHTNDDPAGSPTWSDWEQLLVGDFTARAFEFRARLFSNATTVTPLITKLAVEVDMPDRVLSDDNVSVGASGLAVTFSPAFKEIPAIGVTPRNLASGDYWTITSISRSGFTVQFFDNTDTGVARTMDWIAKGFGREVV